MTEEEKELEELENQEEEIVPETELDEQHPTKPPGT